jgi:hypothetical protein
MKLHLLVGAGATFLAVTPPSAAEPRTIRCGDAVLTVNEIADYEDSHVEIAFRDRAGVRLRPDISHPGVFKSLCSHGAVLLFDNSSHHEPSPSLLLNASGQLIASIEFGYTDGHGVTRDEKLFWSQTFDGSGRLTHLRVYDFRGALVLRKSYDAATTERVAYEGAVYEIAIRKPDLPG